MKVTRRKRLALTKNRTNGSFVKWFSTLIVVAGLGCLALAVRVAHANPPGTIHYPDLQTLPPFDIRIQNDTTTHQKLLRFSNAIANLGEGPMDLIPQNNA